MAKRKVPDTSRAAHEAIKDRLPSHYDRILKALQVLGVANYEELGKQAGMDKVSVNRRLKEMREMSPPMVVKLESKSITQSGNRAYNYGLSEQYQLQTPHPVTQLIDKTAEAQQFLNELQSGKHDPITKSFIQPVLF